MPCAEKQAEKMSKESRAYLMQMMGGVAHIEKRQKMWESNWRENWKSACLFSDEEIKLNDEYHIVGQFMGGKLLPQMRSEEHTSELQSRPHLVCRLLLEKK